MKVTTLPSVICLLIVFSMARSYPAGPQSTPKPYPYPNPYEYYYSPKPNPYEYYRAPYYSQPPQYGYAGVRYNTTKVQPPSYHQSPEKVANIISSVYELNPADSSFAYSYETDNGISAQAQGHLTDKGQIIQGEYVTVDAEGKLSKVAYVADENGYNAQGDSIPTVPPIIARALEYLKTLPPSQEPPHTVYAASKNYNPE